MSTRRPFRRAFMPVPGDSGPTLPSQQPRLPQYQVILRRSPHPPLPRIVRLLRDVVRFAEAEATYRMWESYHRGQTVVMTTHLERAELYVELLRAGGLSVSVEPLVSLA